MKLLKSEWLLLVHRRDGSKCIFTKIGRVYICGDWLEEFYTLPVGIEEIRLVLSSRRIQDSDPIYLRGYESTYGSWSWEPDEAGADAFLYPLGEDIADAGILEVDKCKKFYLRVECR